MSIGATRARLRPPRSGRPGIVRPRLAGTVEALTSPVLVIDAEAGYGKSTAADLITAGRRRAWFGLAPVDRDPLVFLESLVRAVRLAAGVPPDDPIGDLDPATGVAWPRMLDALLDLFEELTDPPEYLVLDDYHLVEGSPVDAVLGRLVEHRPPDLQIVVTTRLHLRAASWTRQRAYGELQTLGRSALAFDADEVTEYFGREFAVALTPFQARWLIDETEGWPIALSLLGQHLRDHDLSVDASISEMPDSRDEIFAYLGDQVFRNQPAYIRAFLLAICGLEVLEGDVCGAVASCSPQSAAGLLAELEQRGLFCTREDGVTYRLHQLFRDFLDSQLDDDSRRTFAVRAAAHYRRVGRPELAAVHAARAGLLGMAAADADDVRRRLLEAGQHFTLLAISDSLGEEALDAYPTLRIGRSHALRMASRYREALWEAERARGLLEAGPGENARTAPALTAIVQVHLDTVEPRLARPALAQLGRLEPQLPPEARRQWHAMVAENHVNAGSLREAGRLLEELTDLDAGLDLGNVLVRLVIRRGELHRGRAILEARSHGTAAKVPRAHREQAALLAWINGLLGYGEEAERQARLGIHLGSDLRSPIITCVCQGRLGLAQLCRSPNEPEEAVESFRASLATAEQMDLPRFRAEPLIGLTISAHRTGDTTTTMRCAHQALEILDLAGDAYMYAMATLAVGVALAEQGNPDATIWLARARAQSAGCGDAYLPLLADQWLGLLALRAGRTAEFAQYAGAALNATSRLSLDDIWVDAPWLGVTSPAARSDWLAAARQVPEVGEYAGYLGSRIVAPTREALPVPPGRRTPTLRIQTLGRFAVLRDGEEIPARAWTRRKAMQILWLLVTSERHSLRREEIIDQLWEYPTDSVLRQFRVCLHALHTALEPERSSREDTHFVRSADDRLWLDPATVQIDLDEFRRLARAGVEQPGDAGLAATLAALDLYDGPFLADAPYFDPVVATREAVAATYRDLVLTAAHALCDRGEYLRAASVGRRGVERDPYHEGAYRSMATAYLAAGDTAAAVRIQEQCRRRMHDDLGISIDWDLDVTS